MRRFKIKIEAFVTMWTDLEKAVYKNGIDPNISEKEAVLQASNVKKAIELAGERLAAWGKKTFPERLFCDDTISVHFQLWSNKVIVAKAAVSVWTGHVTIHSLS